MDMLFITKLLMECFKAFFIGFVPVILLGIFWKLTSMEIEMKKLTRLKEHELDVLRIEETKKS